MMMDDLVMKHVTLPLLSVLMVTGNSMLIYVILAHKTLRTVTNLFVLSLALSDLLLGLIIIPLLVLAELGLLGASPWVCLGVFSVAIAQVLVSCLTLMAIALERYLAITRPLQHHALLTTRFALFIIAFCWVYSVLIGALPLLGWNAIAGWTSPPSASALASASTLASASASASSSVVASSSALPGTTSVPGNASRFYHDDDTDTLHFTVAMTTGEGPFRREDGVAFEGNATPGWDGDSPGVTAATAIPCRYNTVVGASFAAFMYPCHFVLLWLAMLGLYAQIYMRSRNQHSSKEKVRRLSLCLHTRRHSSVRIRENWRALRVLAVVVGYFIFSWLPVIVWYAIWYDGFSTEYVYTRTRMALPSWFYNVGITLAFGNSAVNPFLYGLANRNIRRQWCKVCLSKAACSWLCFRWVGARKDSTCTTLLRNGSKAKALVEETQFQNMVCDEKAAV